MKVTKFRVWDGKEMYYFDNFSINDWDTKDFMHFQDLMNNQKRKAVVLQFTGLLDSKGVEIYEGDIVEVPYVDPMGGLHMDTVGYKASIGFDNGGFVLLNRFDKTPLIESCRRYQGEYIPNYGNRVIIENHSILTIIGNIHENPELLDK